MKAALVHHFSNPPQYGAFAEPVPGPDETVVTVSAAALSPLVKVQASGQHYSRANVFPFIPGVDGVGKVNGQRVYFAFPKPPYGAMAEQVAVNNGLWVPLPTDLDDVAAAALANPGMSSWAALTLRAKLVPGETVLINGATGTAGRLAIQIAKHLGAAKVIATGRNPGSLRALPALGADEVIALNLSEEELTERFRQAMSAGIDVVLDYLWGHSAEQLIAALSGSGSSVAAPRVRFVQIGNASGPAIALPGAALRSSRLELLGSGLGSVSHSELVVVVGALLNAAASASLQVETESVPLTEVAAAWNRDTENRRLVFTL